VVLTPRCMHSGMGESDTSTPTIIHGTKDIHPQKELQNIISQLEEENRCMVTFCSGNVDD
jgi:hypothetical protein